jgi:cytochrome c553
LRLIAFFLAALTCAAPAFAIDDRFNPAQYAKGGFAAADNPAYAKECGSCHFLYLPGMLPARSWHKLMGLKGHFGETLGLEPDAAGTIERYLTDNAADRSDRLGSQVMLERLPADAAPTRITNLPLMLHRHVVVRNLMGASQVKVKTLVNCDACHEKAATGSFAYDEILVPGLTKVLPRGGSQF